MNAPRQNNTVRFVAVLSACLGLLLVGVPAQEAQARSAREGLRSGGEVPAAIRSLLNQKAFASPLVGFLARAQKLAAAHHSFFQLDGCRESAQPEKILYQKSQPLIENRQFLIVPHLARAALSDVPATGPAAKSD